MNYTMVAEKGLAGVAKKFKTIVSSYGFNGCVELILYKFGKIFKNGAGLCFIGH